MVVTSERICRAKDETAAAAAAAAAADASSRSSAVMHASASFVAAEQGRTISECPAPCRCQQIMIHIGDVNSNETETEINIDLAASCLQGLIRVGEPARVQSGAGHFKRNSLNRYHRQVASMSCRCSA